MRTLTAVLSLSLMLAACGGDPCQDLKDRCQDLCGDLGDELDGPARNCSGVAETLSDEQCEARLELEQAQLCSNDQVF